VFNPVDKKSFRNVINPVQDSIIADADSVTILANQFFRSDRAGILCKF